MKKATILLVAVILFTLCFGTTAYAAEPRWNNTNTIVKGISFGDSTNGNAYVGVTGKIGTSRIEGKIDVYRQVGSLWIHVAGAENAADYGQLDFGVQFSAVSNTYYKAEYTITVYRNGTSEVIQLTEYATCP